MRVLGASLVEPVVKKLICLPIFFFFNDFFCVTSTNKCLNVDTCVLPTELF